MLSKHILDVKGCIVTYCNICGYLPKIRLRLDKFPGALGDLRIQFYSQAITS